MRCALIFNLNLFVSTITLVHAVSFLISSYLLYSYATLKIMFIEITFYVTISIIIIIIILVNFYTVTTYFIKNHVAYVFSLTIIFRMRSVKRVNYYIR